uniref:Rab-GTPase-TBC domain-containing protein n=1 Tax=Tanacetum cinerariifolium TaxID=118510 RepID=A0A6L2J760_TANCI|nr:Rab-GTPase-TBC domain-containing protein [Tanacetum cinerariifolium]
MLLLRRKLIVVHAAEESAMAWTLINHPTVLMRVDQEKKVTENARAYAEQDAGAQRYATELIQEKHEVATASLVGMEN